MRVRLWAFEDRSFSFQIKPPPTSWMLKRAAGIKKATSQVHIKIGAVSIKHIYEIAKIKRELDPDQKMLSLDAICSVRNIRKLDDCRTMQINRIGCA